jgi:hypothetical protein
MTAENSGEEPCGELRQPVFDIEMNRKGARE